MNRHDSSTSVPNFEIVGLSGLETKSGPYAPENIQRYLILIFKCIQSITQTHILSHGLYGDIQKLRNGHRGGRDFVTYCYVFFEGEGGIL